MNIYRSGFVFLIVEGLMSVVGGLFGNNGNGVMFEEEFRFDFVYLSYYYSNVNLNLRLFLFLLLKEDWRFV